MPGKHPVWPARLTFPNAQAKRTRAVISALILLVAALFGLHLIRQHWTDEKVHYEQANTVARDISAAAERVVLAARTRVEVLSTLDSLRAGDWAAFDASLRTVPHPENSWFVVYDRDGNALVNTLRPYGEPGIPPLTLSRPDSLPLIRQAIDGPGLIVGRLQWAPLARTHAVAVTTPVATDGGGRYGLLEATRQSVFNDLLPGIHLPGSWRGGIIDRDGSTIAGPGAPADDPLSTRRIFEAATARNGQPLLTRRDGFRIQEVVFRHSDATGWISFVQLERFDPTLRLFLLLSAVAATSLLLAQAIDHGLVRALRDVRAPVQGLAAALRTALEHKAVSERKLNRFWDQATDALFILRREADGTLAFEAANHAFLHLMRIPPARRHRLGWEEMDAGRAALLRQCLEPGPQPGQMRRFLRDLPGPGDVRSYELRLSGGSDSVFGSIRDLTEITQAKANLRRIGTQLLAAQDGERRRIARDLHDSTAQLLAAAGMRMARARAGDAAAAAHLVEAQALIERSQQEIRTTAYLLHPPLLDELGLSAALEWYSVRLARQAGIAIAVAVAPDIHASRLPAEVEAALFRVTQEALSNAIRHAACSTIHVTLDARNRGLLLRVKDNGRGLEHPVTTEGRDGAAVTSFGIGIYGMSERVRQLHGWLRIQRGKPSGTVVEAWIPAHPPTA